MKKKVKWFVNVEMLIVNLRPNLQLRNIWHISRLPSQNLDAQMLNAKKFQHKQYYSFTNAPFYNSYVSLAILWCGSWIDSSVGPLCRAGSGWGIANEVGLEGLHRQCLQGGPRRPQAGALAWGIANEVGLEGLHYQWRWGSARLLRATARDLQSAAIICLPPICVASKLENALRLARGSVLPVRCTAAAASYD